jgi:hypothetical protein
VGVLREGPGVSHYFTGPACPEPRASWWASLPLAPRAGLQGALEELWLQIPAPLGGGGQAAGALQPELPPEPDVTLTLNGKSSPE